MFVLDQLASAPGRNDEIPNQELAAQLVESRDAEAIQELVDNLTNKNKAIRSDCIKVLYEIGAIKPELIADYVDEFVALLSSRDNRLVWGGMTAMGSVAPIKPQAIWRHIDTIMDATTNGSVITQDWGVRVLRQSPLLMCIMHSGYFRICWISSKAAARKMSRATPRASSSL